MNTYISLDLETTGFSAETSEIIEIGAWKVKNGVVVDKFHSLVRPITYIPRHIQDITGITDEDVKDCDTIISVLLEFNDWCEDLPFLGHNVKFDYDFLCAKGNPVGLDFSLRGSREGIDTLKLCRELLNLHSNKLEDIVNYFNISIEVKDSSIDRFHRALYDAYMTKLVYDRFSLVFSSVISVCSPVKLSDGTGYGKVVNNDTLSFS